jgi:hypothetical protein
MRHGARPRRQRGLLVGRLREPSRKTAHHGFHPQARQLEPGVTNLSIKASGCGGLAPQHRIDQPIERRRQLVSPRI